MKRNVGSLDRVLRILVGLGLLVLAVKGHVWGWIGVVPILTAVVGFCPAYLPLGFSSCSDS